MKSLFGKIRAFFRAVYLKIFDPSKMPDPTPVEVPAEPDPFPPVPDDPAPPPEPDPDPTPPPQPAGAGDPTSTPVESSDVNDVLDDDGNPL